MFFSVFLYGELIHEYAIDVFVNALLHEFTYLDLVCIHH